jgi:hypothetical protein
MNVMFVRFLQRFKTVASWIGEKQIILIYTLLYLTVVGPVALIYKTFSDPFQYRKRSLSTFWVPREPTAVTLDEARRE